MYFNSREEEKMGLFAKLFKEPELDQAKSDANAKKMRALNARII